MLIHHPRRLALGGAIALAAALTAPLASAAPSSTPGLREFKLNAQFALPNSLSPSPMAVSRSPTARWASSGTSPAPGR